MFIGLTVNLCLQGIMTMQTYIYYSKYPTYVQPSGFCDPKKVICHGQGQEVDQDLRVWKPLTVSTVLIRFKRSLRCMF